MLHRLNNRLCGAVSSYVAQTRNTVIVKRVHKPPLIGTNPMTTPQKIIDKAVVHSDDDKWMLYEVVEKHQLHHSIKLILLRNVDDYGKKGQVIEVEFSLAYKDLLLPKFAVYHSEENCEKYKDILIPEGEEVFSSPSAQVFYNTFSKRVFDVCMNITNSWTVQPWHIKATLRKHRIWCHHDQIDIPGGIIEGPNLELENKEFIAVLTVNNKEKLQLRCRLHHVGEGEVDNPAWYLQQAEPIWEHERDQLLDMNKAPPNKAQRENKEFKDQSTMCERDDWLGCQVSLDCDTLGYFQGVISRISYSDQTVTLEKPFQNGLACKFPEITINSTDITDLKILKSKEELKEESAVKGSSSSVIKVQVKKKSKPQTLQSGLAEAEYLKDTKARNTKVQSYLSGNQMRSSPRFTSHARASPRYERHQHAGTPTRYRERQVEEDYFRAAGRGGSALNEEEKIMIEKDFDFEANLAMFDKEREMREIEAELSNKPDIVRLVNVNVRQPEPKYRNDENVLGSVLPEYRQIVTGEEEVGDRHFVTDSGLIVPSISLQLREKLQSSVKNHGIGLERLAEMMGRAATELAIHLLGGQHRLNPSNMHQVPTAVFLCGTSQVATFGLASARHLASHGVKTQVLLPEAARFPPALEAELRLYRLTGGKVVSKARDLPSGAVDMIVMAMEDLEMWSQERCQPWHRAAISWAEANRAPVLAIDPPPHPPPLDIKMSLAWGLPLSYSPQSGKLYLVNLGIPKNIYKEVGIKFSSPFGAKFVIPLHQT